MPRSAEPELSREALLKRAQKRVDDKKASDKRRKYFQFVVLACVLLGVLAVFYSTSNDAATYFQHSYAYTTQNAAGGCTWAWNTVGKLYNTTFTGVGVWVFNTTPTNATAAPPAPPPAPPKDAPRDTKNAPQNSTDNSTTHGDDTTENSTGRENKKEDAANSTTTGGKNNTEDAANSTTTGGRNNTEDATNNTTTGGENKKEDAANNSTTGGESETDSPYTVLGVVGDVAVFALSFAGYVCYFVATGG